MMERHEENDTKMPQTTTTTTAKTTTTELTRLVEDSSSTAITGSQDESQEEHVKAYSDNHDKNLEDAVRRGQFSATLAAQDPFHTTSPQTTTSPSSRKWFYWPLFWCLFYLGLWILLVLLTRRAFAVVYGMNFVVNMVAYICSLDFVRALLQLLYHQAKACRTSSSSPPDNPPSTSGTALSRKLPWWGFTISLALVCASPWTSQWYASSVHVWHPPDNLTRLLNQLQAVGTNATGENNYTNYRMVRAPLQALTLGNREVKQLAAALQVHLDHLGRQVKSDNNSTVVVEQQLPWVKELNLIGNVFNDRGAAALVEVLRHPHAYTEQLLVGRNANLGDGTARALASLIRQHSVTTSIDTRDVPPSQMGSATPLMWLEMGGTSISVQGVRALWQAMGKRPFEYLGLEYTDRILWRRFPYFWKANPIPQSIQYLSEATYLQQVGLAGNTLADQHMATLTEQVLATNVTQLVLVDNRIGDAGVQDMRPLVYKLEELQLGINGRIGDQGALALADAIREHPENATLRVLSLFKCGVGATGAKALKFLEEDPTIKLKYVSV